MFREIRRQTKKISQDEALQVLKTARYGMIAVNGDHGYPYAVPVNYLYDEAKNKIYFHGSGAGHKADSLKKNDKVCFTVVGDEEIRDLPWAPYAKSTVVFGRCHAVGDKSEAVNLCRIFALKYYPGEEIVENALSKDSSGLFMYVIDIEHISGKMIQEK